MRRSRHHLLESNGWTFLFFYECVNVLMCMFCSRIVFIHYSARYTNILQIAFWSFKLINLLNRFLMHFAFQKVDITNTRVNVADKRAQTIIRNGWRSRFSCRIISVKKPNQSWIVHPVSSFVVLSYLLHLDFSHIIAIINLKLYNLFLFNLFIYIILFFCMQQHS
jgi:hypothetical protein